MIWVQPVVEVYTFEVFRIGESSGQVACDRHVCC